MSEQEYKGSCHCDKVTYSVTLDLEKPVITCNCSMCSRAGTMLAFVPRAKFHIDSGSDELTSYKFNKNVIDHLFCRRCGIKPFAFGIDKDGQPTAAINVRCLKGVDLSALPTFAYDGKKS